MTLVRKATGQAFTLIEMMLAITIVGILAATALIAVRDEANHAKDNTLRMNLYLLRTQIELYRQHHTGRLPTATLAELTLATNAAGTIGQGPTFLYGPYVNTVPENPYTGSAAVRVAASNPPTAASGAADAGWLYDPTTGGLWIDDSVLFTE